MEYRVVKRTNRNGLETFMPQCNHWLFWYSDMLFQPCISLGEAQRVIDREDVIEEVIYE